MKRLALVWTAIAIAAATHIGFAQTPSLSAARLHVSVEVRPQNLFVYQYTVENGASSTVGISKMTIDISVPPGSVSPSAAGLTHGPGFFADSSLGAANATNPRAGAIVPVGLSAPQPAWRTSIGGDATARWVAVNDRSSIFPKQRLAGFVLASHGPPSLRRFTLVPHIDPDRAPVPEPGDDPGEADRYKQELNQYVESRSVAGMTLAPAAPVKMTADALLASLASEIPQARSLHWISSDVPARNVTAKLQAARAALSRHQQESAGNILRALRTDIAAQAGKTLTSEAVALLDVNIQFVLPMIARP
jgi:hypothetical protein